MSAATGAMMRYMEALAEILNLNIEERLRGGVLRDSVRQTVDRDKKRVTTNRRNPFSIGWLRGRDLNPRPLGYEPNELPDCSTPRHGQKRFILTRSRQFVTRSLIPGPVASPSTVTAATIFPMKTVIAIVALLILPGLSAAQLSPDEKGVRAAVEQYFKGHATGSADEMRKAFLPTARIDAVRDGQLLSRTVDEFVSGF